MRATVVMALAAAAFIPGQSVAQPSSAPNLELASGGGTTYFEDGLLVFRVSEAAQGGTDLNGDGDAWDAVLHVHDSNTGITTNLGLDNGSSGGFPSLIPENGLLAIAVSEARQGGVDLNGDLDTDDDVLHIYDTATGTTTNVGLDAFITNFEGNFVVFFVREADQGNTDLNGDGDTADSVLHYYDVSTGSVTNIGRPIGAPQVDGTLIAGLVSEFGHGGTDLNGDGDTNDRVLHVHDTTTGITVNTQLAGADYYLRNGKAAYMVSEGAQGQTDLNGDGDTVDTHVLHIYDVSSGSVTNTGLTSRNVGARLVWFEGTRVGVAVDEAGGVAADLNGDSDTNDDHVLHVYDTATGSVTNVGFDITFARPSGDLVAMFVDEFHQGNADLNGDLDTADVVAHIYDQATGSVTNVGLVGGIRIEDGLLLLQVSEAEQGNTDLNGDGDTLDGVLHVYDIAAASTTNVGLDVFQARYAAGRIGFVVFEGDQGGQDLNGDGDATDSGVAHVFDVATGTTTNLGLTTWVSSVLMYGDHLALDVYEAGQGESDLNGDGDTTDCVLHLVSFGVDDGPGPPDDPGGGAGKSDPPADPGPPGDVPGNGNPPDDPGPPENPGAGNGQGNPGPPSGQGGR